MEKRFEEGERILIVLNSGENFEGDYVNGSETRIEIENFVHYETGNKFDSKWTFYKGEISSVLRIGGKKSNEPNKTKVDENKILIPREEYERLLKMVDDYIVIKTDDKNFFDAVELISNYESIGVIASNCERGRNGRIKILALSTWKQVYIFDFHNFRTKHFPRELADILKSHYVKKVVFNGGPLLDCFLHAYKIPINNVYDIQISHMMLVKNSTGKCQEKLPTIGECLTEYFNFSSTFLTSSCEILKDSSKSPMDVDKQKKISRLVTYLIFLKDHQMSLMLKDYNKAVQDYHDLFTQSNDYHLLEMAANQSCTEKINNLIPTSPLNQKSIENLKYE